MRKRPNLNKEITVLILEEEKNHLIIYCDI